MIRKDLQDGVVVALQITAIESMITGVLYATQKASGEITLVYTDQTRESRVADFLIEDKTIFQTVSYVQAGRAVTVTL